MADLAPLDRDAVNTAAAEVFGVDRSQLVYVDVVYDEWPKATVVQPEPVDLQASKDALLDATGLRGKGTSRIEIRPDGATVTFEDGRVEHVPWADEVGDDAA